MNTGWTGGGYGVGERFSIPITRAVIAAIQSGELENAETQTLAGFNLDVPLAVEGVDKDLLNPSRNWGDLESYAVYEEKLVNQFKTNFEKFDVKADIVSAK